LREAKGLTQETLANRAGLTQGYVGAIERGEKDLSALITLSKLSKALGVDVSHVMLDPEKLREKVQAGEDASPTGGIELILLEEAVSAAEIRQNAVASSEETSSTICIDLPNKNMQLLSREAERNEVTTERLLQILIGAALRDSE